MWALLNACEDGSDSTLSHRALLYLQELAEELSTALPAPLSGPKSPKVSSPTKPKKTRQAASQGEEDGRARDEDFVLQVEGEDEEESEAPSENSSDPEPVAPRSTPRGPAAGVTWINNKEMGKWEF